MLLPAGCIDYKKGNDIKYFTEGDHLAILSLHIKYFTDYMYFSRFNCCKKGNDITLEES
jgi:hypothetical protein